MANQVSTPTPAVSLLRKSPQDNGGDSSAISLPETVEIQIRSLCLNYGSKQALHDIDMDISRYKVTAFIGPSGCGKSTLLRCLNRLNDLVDGVKVTGSILLQGKEILDPTLDVTELRKRVGMVFQKPNPFPKTIYENVAYGPRILGCRFLYRYLISILRLLLSLVQ